MTSQDNYTPGQVLRKPADWKNLHFYQKMDTLFQLTFIFCKRFLPAYGDRTVDQMVQAARSGKQNIIEGSEDGKTSTEMELKLLNVARASVGELREDYRDHINKHRLPLWAKGHSRFQPMQDFTRAHNLPEDYSNCTVVNFRLNLRLIHGHLRSAAGNFFLFKRELP